MFGTIVLDLCENTLITTAVDGTKSLNSNISLKAALFFYVLIAKKVHFNYKPTIAAIAYSFKLKLNNFNSIFTFQVKLLTDHRNNFFSAKFLISKRMRRNFFLRACLLDGVSINESNDFFQNLYKDIRPKVFCIYAKFAKALILF